MRCLHNGLACTARQHIALDWIVQCTSNALQWIGTGYNGLDCKSNVLQWIGTGCNGLDCTSNVLQWIGTCCNGLQWIGLYRQRIAMDCSQWIGTCCNGLALGENFPIICSHLSRLGHLRAYLSGLGQEGHIFQCLQHPLPPSSCKASTYLPAKIVIYLIKP